MDKEEHLSVVFCGSVTSVLFTSVYSRDGDDPVSVLLRMAGLRYK